MKEIADIKKVDYALMSVNLRVARIPRHTYRYVPNRPPNQRNIDIKTKYNNGVSMVDLSRQYGISKQRILQILKKQGTKLRGRKSKKH